MDCMSSVLELDHGTSCDDLLQFSSSISFQDHQAILQNEVLSLQPLEIGHGGDLAKKKTQSSNRKPGSNSTAFGGVKGENPSKKQKTIHRDIERQRRQDMATLYRSLRSLLPLEYLKGKRSISDHIHETVKYIKHLEEKLQELNNKRDELKKHASGSSPPDSATESVEGCEKCILTVKPCCVGVEVVVDTSSRKGFPLSRVLEVVTEEGLSVVSYISTKVNKRMLYNITCEVDEGRSIDVSELEKTLTNSALQSSLSRICQNL